MNILFLGKSCKIVEDAFYILHHTCHEFLPEYFVIPWISDKRCKFEQLPKYDVGISFLYTYKVPKQELEKAKFFNWHPGIHGGRNLAYHAITNRETHFGATIHEMDEKFDSGPIIYRERFDIENWMTAGDLVERSQRLLLEMFKKYIKILLSGNYTYANETWEKYYSAQKINDYVNIDLDMHQKEPFDTNKVRALTCPPHYAKIHFYNRDYRIIPI